MLTRGRNRTFGHRNVFSVLAIKVHYVRTTLSGASGMSVQIRSSGSRLGTEFLRGDLEMDIL